MDTDSVREAVRKLISLLVAGDFSALKQANMLGPSTQEEYAAALQRYLRGREVLTEPPEAEYAKLDLYKTADANRQRLDFDLWTTNGRSDLTAQIYVEQLPSGAIHVTLYDLRVL